MNHAIQEMFSSCVKYFDALSYLAERNASVSFARVNLGEYSIVHLRCGNATAISSEIIRVFDREGNPVERVTLPYTQQRAWYKRLVVEEGFPAANLMELLDEHSRDYFWRERLQ
jgi:hypothetical protein